MINKVVYQKNRRYMAWASLGMMIVTTIAIIISPERFEKVDSIIMMIYGSLSAVIGAYFGFAKRQPINVKKD